MFPNSHEAAHLSLTYLWTLAQNPSTSLSVTHLEHLESCERCVCVLGLCRVSNSVELAHGKVVEHGFMRD